MAASFVASVAVSGWSARRVDVCHVTEDRGLLRIPAGAVSSLAASVGAAASVAAAVVVSVVVAGVSSAGTATGFCSSAILIWGWYLGKETGYL